MVLHSVCRVFWPPLAVQRHMYSSYVLFSLIRLHASDHLALCSFWSGYHQPIPQTPCGQKTSPSFQKSLLRTLLCSAELVQPLLAHFLLRYSFESPMCHSGSFTAAPRAAFRSSKSHHHSLIIEPYAVLILHLPLSVSKIDLIGEATLYGYSKVNETVSTEQSNKDICLL